MAKKTNAAKKASAEKRNKAALADALNLAMDYIASDKDVMGGEAGLIPIAPPLCGHVTAKLGNGGFRVTLKGGKEVQGLIRGIFKGGKNSVGFVSPGMYVILAPNAGRHDMKVHEIVGVINNRKDMKALMEAGLIDEDAKDDMFDHSGDESESESGSAHLVKPEEADGVDIDAL